MSSSSSSSSSPPSLNRRPTYLNNPAAVAPVHVDVDAPVAERDAHIEEAVREICPDFFLVGGDAEQRHPTTQCLSIRQLGGGLSNHLYVVVAGVARHGEEGGETKTEEQPESLLVRVHGEDDDDENDDPDGGGGSFVDRAVENRVLAVLSTSGLAPTFHGRFRNGRVEEFYEGYRTLSWDEMGDRRYAGGIADAMADLHRVEMPEGVLSGGGGRDGAEGEGDVWGRVTGWLGMAAGDGSDDSHGADLDEMRTEWAWLESELRRLPPDESVKDGATTTATTVRTDEAAAFFRQAVFTHMDCQSLNILTPSESLDDDDDDDEAPIRLIDFEYAALNPRAADIANTFCEHCDMNNLAADYEAQHPAPEVQNYYLRRYVRRADADLARRLDDGDGGDDDDDGKGGRAWDDFLAAAREEVGKHALISHLGWAVWALAQKRRGGGGIDFDYGAYAALRMEGYRLFKGWFWR